MKYIITLAFLATFFVSKGASPVKTITGNLTGNINWVNDTIYLLKGKVFLKSGATLNIAAGTIIKGDTATPGSALIITRGAKIYAIGTPDKPIVFTSSAPVGTRKPGQWGGICIAGNAKVNVAGGEAPFEGGNLSNPDGSTTDDKYGGLNDADNSGTLKYVRIEFAGYPYQQNNELNSLTMGGVGNGTTIEYVQCSYGFDDAFEFFGGTVNANHLISFRGNDDDFDTDFGYRGKVQYGVVIRDTALADPVSGANAFESDNDATGTGANPKTAPVFSNFTILGPKQSSTTAFSNNHKRGAHIRRNSRMSLFNSIIAGYPVGIKLDGDSCHMAADSNFLELKNNILAGCPQFLDSTAGVTWNMTPWFFSTAASNSNLANNTDLMLTAPFNFTAPNLIPQVGSPALSGASFTSSKLSGFTPTTFVGAFGFTNWTTGWANFDPQNEPYTSGYGVIPDAIAMNELTNINVYPNPTNGKVIVLGLTTTANYSIINQFGQKVHQGSINTNNTLDISNLPSGIYTLSLLSNNGYKNLKLQIVH